VHKAVDAAETSAGSEGMAGRRRKNSAVDARWDGDTAGVLRSRGIRSRALRCGVGRNRSACRGAQLVDHHSESFVLVF